MRIATADAPPETHGVLSPRWDQLLRDPTFAHYARPEQVQRVSSLLSLLPRGRSTVLDVGARDGFLSAILADFYDEVTALDLVRPGFEFERVVTVKGDATRLQFPDDAFDVVFCAEVLEHIPDLGRACAELARVARHEVVIGVPNRQDTRVGRTSCVHCGAVNPPYGHVNTFTSEKLRLLFPQLTPVSEQLVGNAAVVTNSVAAGLRQLAGNPDGTYDQQEPCIACGGRLLAPPRTTLRRAYSRLADSVDALQRPFIRPQPYWLHMLFVKQ